MLEDYLCEWTSKSVWSLDIADEAHDRFDIFLDLNYPISPPKVAFVLQGNETNMNPNLHPGGTGRYQFAPPCFTIEFMVKSDTITLFSVSVHSQHMGGLSK